MSCLLFRRPDCSDDKSVNAIQPTVRFNIRKAHCYGESGFGRSLVEISLADDEIARRKSLSVKESPPSQAVCERLSTANRSEPMPACHETINCTELLEHILQYLRPRDLIEVQLVSRTWRSLISSSPTLLQCLFLKGRKPDQAWLLPATPDQGRMEHANHHTLLGPAAPELPVDRLVPIFGAKLSGAGFVVQSELNTILPWQHLHFFRPLDDDHAIWHHCDEVHPVGLPPHSGLTTSVSSVSRIPYKYARMFLCQPPAQRVEVAVYAGQSRALVAKEFVTAFPGVTLSDLQGVIRRASERTDLRCVEVGFWVRDFWSLIA